MISAVPAEWFLKGRGNARNPPKVVYDEYIRCFTKKTITGACRDYRAFDTIDFEMDTADKDRQIGMPLLILWGTRGAPPTQEYPTVWRKFASNLVDAYPRGPLDRCINQSEIFWKLCEPDHTMISQPWGIYTPLVPLRPGGSDAKGLVWSGVRSRSHNCQSGAGAGLPQELRRVREGARTRSRRWLHS